MCFSRSPLDRPKRAPILRARKTPGVAWGWVGLPLWGGGSDHTPYLVMQIGFPSRRQILPQTEEPLEAVNSLW